MSKLSSADHVSIITFSNTRLKVFHSRQRNISQLKTLWRSPLKRLDIGSHMQSWVERLLEFSCIGFTKVCCMDRVGPEGLCQHKHPVKTQRMLSTTNKHHALG